MSYAILRATKIKNNGNIAASLSHNYRDRETHNADVKKAHLNSHDYVSKDAAFDAIQNRLPEKVRKDGVRCIEYMITASPDFFKDNNRLTQDKYFESAKEWLIEKHGAENVITTSIHRDETSPHLIAYVVPYVFNEKKQKENLNCKHFLGGRKTLSDMQTNFHKHVSHFGLERGVVRSVAQHQTVKDFYSKIKDPAKPLKEIVDSLVVPIPSFFESKEKYGLRVANGIWDQASDQFQDLVLKTTSKNYTDLEKENKRLMNELKSSTLLEGKLKRELYQYKKSMALTNKIDSLPSEYQRGLIAYVDSIIEKIENKDLINPIKDENKISFKWNKGSKNYHILINDQRINKKVPISFIEEIKKTNKFLNQYSNNDIYNSTMKSRAEAPSFSYVNADGFRIKRLEQVRTLGNSRDLSM